MKPTPTNILLLLAATAAIAWGAYFALQFLLDAGAGADDGRAADRERLRNEGVHEQQAEPTPGERPGTKPLAAPVPSGSPTKPSAPAEHPAAVTAVPGPNDEAVPLPGSMSAAAPADREPPQSAVQKLREQHQVAKARFAALGKRFDGESRDASWAGKKEQRVRDLFVGEDRENLLVDVECRTTLCKMQAKVTTSSDFFALMTLPGLKEEVSQEGVALPEGPADDRVLTTYFARHGYTVQELIR